MLKMLLKTFGLVCAWFFLGRRWGLRMGFDSRSSGRWDRKDAALLFQLLGFRLWVQLDRKLLKWIIRHCTWIRRRSLPRYAIIKYAPFGFSPQWKADLAGSQEWGYHAWVDGGYVKYVSQSVGGKYLGIESVPRNRAFHLPMEGNRVVGFRPKTRLARAVNRLTGNLLSSELFLMPEEKIAGWQ